MDSNKFSNWLQVAGNFGLLVGLVLVAIQINQNSDQLNQTHQLVRAELVSNFFDAWIALDSSTQSENFAKVLSRSHTHPKKLTLEEMIELDGYLVSVFVHIDRGFWLNERGIFQEGIEPIATDIARTYLGDGFAQSWWVENRHLYDSKITAIVDQELQDVSKNERQEYFNRIQARISE